MKKMQFANGTAKWGGIADRTAAFVQAEQMMDTVNWAKFVDIYRSQPDASCGWRGEYWGKQMRGGALVYRYTQDEALYEVLTATVKDMLSTQEEDGRISSYNREGEFDSWDLWSRKYVLLGCMYYMEICKDEDFKAQITQALCRHADYIIDHIGPEKKSILKASRSWGGVNSVSILEPIVRLYKLTNDQKYLDFAEYIISTGGADGYNIFESACENKLLPYQYGISKAYEVMSCFEGLMEYALITDNQRYLQGVINFTRGVGESDISIIGCSGITHELFDHTAWRQTTVKDDVLQETCVTVTWMKLCARVLELTGDPYFADLVEQSFYNAYVGTLNTEHHICEHPRNVYMKNMNLTELIDTFLPFDSYSPLTPRARGTKVGGWQYMPDHSYYGCCACIGGAGIGSFMQAAIMTDDEGLVLNFFEKGTATVDVNGKPVTVTIDTNYPADGHIEITLDTDCPVKVRIPAWTGEGGYRRFDQRHIVLDLPMNLRVMHPITWDTDVVYTDMSGSGNGYHMAKAAEIRHEEKMDHYVALARGPLVLAADERFTGMPDWVFDFEPNGELCDPGEFTLKMKFTDKNGKEFYLFDYASTGRDWKSKIACWLPIP